MVYRVIFANGAKRLFVSASKEDFDWHIWFYMQLGTIVSVLPVR